MEPWESRWAVNFAVQGTSQPLVKRAGIRIYRLLGQFGGRIVVPLHDAYIVDVPSEHLGEAAEMVRRELCNVVREWFPELRPRATINAVHPQCWTKDGGLGIFGESSRPQPGGVGGITTIKQQRRVGRGRTELGHREICLCVRCPVRSRGTRGRACAVEAVSV